jgi:hypothetical protein
MLVVITYDHVCSIYRLANYGVMLLLGVVSLMAGSTTGVLMFPVYGGYQATAAKEIEHCVAALLHNVNICKTTLLH